MTEYNAADLKKIRAAQRAAKIVEDERRLVILNLMSSPAGRNYVFDSLTRCHCFSTSYSPSALAMAFAEGERNIGLQLLTDVMRFAPDQYIQMTREASDKEIANGRRDTDRGSDRDSSDERRDDSGSSNGEVFSDYNPGDGDTVDHS